MPRRALAATLTAVLAGGCGPPSRGEYIERADRLCRDLDAQVGALGTPPTLADALAVLADRGEDVVAGAQRTRVKLGRLRAPSELREMVRRYLRTLDRSLSLRRGAVRAAKTNDPARLRRQLAIGRRLAPEVERSAREIGFRVCGRGPGSVSPIATPVAGAPRRTSTEDGLG